MTDLSNPGIDFFAGKLAPFPRLGTLGHFYLNLFGLGEIETGHTKPTRGYLLNGAIFRVAALVSPGKPFGIFTAFTGIGFTPYAVHGNGQRFMGFLGDGTIAHGSGFKPTGNGLDGLYFLNGDGLTCLEV